MDQSKRHSICLDNAVASTSTADNASVNLQDTSSSPPPYLKLIADCWEHIYDYLSMKDIISIGQTCKRMNQMSGYYIRENQPHLKFSIREKEIYFDYDICIQPDFYPLISKLFISSLSDLDFFSNVKTFDALKILLPHSFLFAFFIV